MRRNCILALVLILLLVVGCSPRTREPTGTVPAILDHVEVHSDDGASQVILAVDHSAYVKLFDAIVAKDTTAMDNLVTAGKAFRVAQGSLALYLEAKTDGVRVQLLQGEFDNKSGWIPFSWMITVK